MTTTDKRVLLLSTITWFILELGSAAVTWLVLELLPQRDDATALEEYGGALMEAATKRALRKLRPKGK